MKHYRLLSLSIVFLIAAAAHAGPRSPSHTKKREEPPVSDRAFEKRLQIKTKYITRKGDTLKTVAGLVYGHSTWWPKLKKFNPKLKKVKPDQVLEIGTRIDYKRPKVTNHYVVQPNDCLIRIAEWKFGASDQWKAIFSKNKGIIKHPDFIRVGDRLHIKENGMITHEKTGRIVMKPAVEEKIIEQPVVAATPEMIATPAAVIEAVVTPAEVLASPAREPAELESGNSLGDPRFLTFGFLVGAIFVIVFYFAYSRRTAPQSQFAEFEDYSHSERSEGPIDVVHHTPPNPRVDVENQLPEVEMDLDADLDEINKEGYHSLFKKRLKKYLGRR